MSIRFEDDPDFNAPMPKPTPRRGFRLWELLLVVAILAVLVALLPPATRSARAPARRAQCTYNLKQIGLALYNYEQAYGALPPACTVDANGRPLHSWRTLILHYLDQGPLYETIDLAKPWDDPANAKALGTALPVFRCPESTAPPNTTTYLAIVGPSACLIPGESRRLAEITDSHERTLMVIEADEAHAVPWMAPVDADVSLVLGLGLKSKLHHAGGTNGCLVDGSVRFLKADTPAKVRRALISISGKDDDAAKEQE